MNPHQTWIGLGIENKSKPDESEQTRLQILKFATKLIEHFLLKFYLKYIISFDRNISFIFFLIDHIFAFHS